MVNVVLQGSEYSNKRSRCLSRGQTIICPDGIAYVAIERGHERRCRRGQIDLEREYIALLWIQVISEYLPEGQVTVYAGVEGNGFQLVLHIEPLI